ncbi:LOW QUALITY PROTEIN: tensin-1-like [Paramacrobiotus metropolitanus]|uniref:LOW QUALITY PROTEIN: tensin-1-like n=1 Tax=Paramacrobiotus metropolitanus TaxID=2943436 RepID=UPI0024465C30|nr:LOW QUALITY PROTEIN: tensin-1-like [Paramacrobiotus metropolitanus]
MDAFIITERLLLLAFPEDMVDNVYRPAIKQISQQLHNKHGDHALIMNVSEPRADIIRLNRNVMDFGWPANLAPPLERLCSMCKQADIWMNADRQRNVLVVHCKGGLGRAAMMIASYMHYTSVCATPSQALDRYAMKLFFDKELKPYILPSQRRYVQYFSGLLTGSIRICSEPVYLHNITLMQVPNFDGKAACRPLFKIYQAQDHLWTSDVYSMSEAEGRRILRVELRPALQLRGDILIKCLHQKRMRPVDNTKDVIFRCQLHTCALTLKDVPIILNKCDLDEASTDIRFPEDGRVELFFSLSEIPPTTADEGAEVLGLGSEGDRHRDIIGHDRRNLVIPLPETSSTLHFDRLPRSANTTGLAWDQGELSNDPLYSYVAGDEPYPLAVSRPHVILESNIPTVQPHSFTSSQFEPSANYGYAVVKKPRSKRAPLASVDTVDGTEPETRGSLSRSEKDRLLSDSIDSGISTVVHHPPPSWASEESSPAHRMEKRAVSPGGTLKSVKFQDDDERIGRPVVIAMPPPPVNGFDNQENRRPAQNVTKSALRSGMDVIDLDSVQPDMEELDRVFESLQQESEDLDRHLSANSPVIKHKTYDKQTQPPLRVITQRSSSTTNSPALERQFSNPTSPHPPVSPDAGLISAYVPEDRKNLAKKYGAFTLGLPTTKPELKPVSSPPPVRRDPQREAEDLYGRTRLRHVESSSSDREQQRKRDEEKLYNTAAVAAADRERAEQRSGYGQIGRAIAAGGESRGTTVTHQSRSLERQRSGEGSLNRPRSPRPRTPTEDERLHRLLNVEEGEFLISNPEEKVRGRLKEVAREGQSDVEEEVVRQAAAPISRPAASSQRLPAVSHPVMTDMSIQASPDVNMESEYIQTDQEDVPFPDRRKKKKVQTSVAGTNTQFSTVHSTPIAYSSSSGEGIGGAAWLQLQHDKLMTRKYGSDYLRSKERHSQMLDELRGSQERMMELVPNRDELENRLPLSSVILREAKTPPLGRRAGDAEPDTRWFGKGKQQRRRQQGRQDYSVASSTVVTRTTAYSETARSQPQKTAQWNGHGREVVTDTDHDSIVDEIDFGDEPLYKTVPGSSQRASRSREVDEHRLRSANSRTGDTRDYTTTTMSQSHSPDLLRRAAPSPKSILKNPSLHRPRKTSASEDRIGAEINGHDSEREREHSLIRRARATTPSFPVSSSLERSGSVGQRGGSRSGSLQRAGYSVYGTRERATSSGRSTPTGYFGLSGSRRSSLTSINNSNLNNDADEFVIHQHPVFVRDLSKFWYKPGITREEAIEILKDKQAGSFLIRDSHSYPGSYGMAVKVDPGQVPGAAGGRSPPEELVRHFLVEPTPKGVHLKGCQNEPVFGSLPALVYQHSVTPLALPCKLLLPSADLTLQHQPLYSEDNLQRLMEQGAACNVSYLVTVDTESLTGPQAVRRGMDVVSQGGGFGTRPPVVHIKVNAQGILLTDVGRKVFFRRYYPIQNISYCGIDPDDRRWKSDNTSLSSARCFGFVNRKQGSRNQNECHVFAELDPEQPAAAVVSFVNKVMMTASAPHPRSLSRGPSIPEGR